MNDRIAKGLEAAFDRHRIVFWTDAARELRHEFETLELPGVEKVLLTGNEFGVKHRILRAEPSQKFLIYREGPEPEKLDNWLLDVQLAHGAFKANQAALWLTEIGLGLEFEDVVKGHEEFFRSAKRLEQLRAMIRPKDTKGAIKLKMLVVCAKGADGAALDGVLEQLLAELADDTDDTIRLIERAKLADELWKLVERGLGYQSPNPSVEDFAITLFKAAYADGLGDPCPLSSEALVFFRRWKNNRLNAEAFEALSAKYAKLLAVEQSLGTMDFRKLMELDAFEDIDRAIIVSLVRGVADRTLAQGDVANWVRQRRQSHWFDRYEDLYEAIRYAAEFQFALAQVNLGMTSLHEGVCRYANTWFRIDQLYRKFIFHMQRSGQASLMTLLFEQVENHYVNSYLLRLNDAWQTHIDAAPKWEAPGIVRQRDFYQTFVGEFRQKGQKICVIISDAMRFEVAEELLLRVRALDRYDAEIQPMLGSVPTYTQLGMASLLPNRDLQIADNDTSAVIVDGQSSQGLENRKKVLAKGRAGDRTTALLADDMKAMPKDDARALFRDHDVIYIYHNLIDAIGDKPTTEERVFDAAEDTLEELVQLVKKMAAANATNLLITADHGFIYQHRPIEESDFATSEVAGDTILFRNRRFVLGHGLKAQQGLRHFTAEAAGLQGDVEVLIPKSINRLRQKGSGSRFVHGGATLQEMVVPVVRISKARQSDTAHVEVEILPGASQNITSSQHAVRFYQKESVTEKMRSRQLRAGIYTLGGELLSENHDLTFDFTSEDPRQRELTVRFLLGRRADDFNNKEVVLKLEERHGETSHYQEYRSVRYVLRRSFANDFDF
ncbi:MAG: TIGR02687 family protein [Sphingomonadales bacterium 28-64-96]|nr:MAG: TIGR02687 family protein [Sphingomonadales bacterium 28-64-96]